MLFAGGFTAVCDSRDICKDRTRPCFRAFGKERWPPVSRARQTSAATVDRFFPDHRRFRAPACWEAGLVWKQEEWRQLDWEERAVLQGMPPGLIEAVSLQLEQEKVTQIKNTIVGLGFHIPSVVLAHLMLFQLQPT